MPIDADSGSSLTQWLLTAFGLGGGGYKIVTHETRITRLETDREKDLETHNKRFERHDEKLDSVKAEVGGLSLLMAGIDAKLDSVKEAVDRNANLYVARRKQHIHDTGGEVDE